MADTSVSKIYRENAIKKINDNCDAETTDYFKFKIPCYPEFKDLLNLIADIKSTTQDKTHSISTKFDISETFTKELQSHQTQLEFLDFETLEKIRIQFLPTSNYHGIAMSNGCSEEYLQIAEKFDVIYKRIKDIPPSI